MFRKLMIVAAAIVAVPSAALACKEMPAPSTTATISQDSGQPTMLAKKKGKKKSPKTPPPPTQS